MPSFMKTVYAVFVSTYFIQNVHGFNFNFMKIHNINDINKMWYPINMDEQKAFNQYIKSVKDQKYYSKIPKQKTQKSKVKNNVNQNIKFDHIPIKMLEQHGEVSMFE